jgi:hypothetical protein
MHLAVRPSAAAHQAIADWPRPELPNVHWSEPAQWLVKVRPLGHVPAAIVPRLIEVITDELDGAPPVGCVTGPTTERLWGQWLGVPVSGLDELAEVVFDVTAPIVPVTHPQPFRADLVLARGRVPKDLAGQPFVVSWTARRLLLEADRSSPRGPRFDEVAAFELDG